MPQVLHVLKRTTRHSAVKVIKCENAVKLYLKRRPTVSSFLKNSPLSYCRLEQPTAGTSWQITAWKLRENPAEKSADNRSATVKHGCHALVAARRLSLVTSCHHGGKSWLCVGLFFTIVFQFLTFVVSFSIFSRYQQSQQLLLVTPRRRLCSKKVL